MGKGEATPSASACGGLVLRGHEHRFTLYDSTAEIVRPRLLGNGGVPSPVTDASYYSHHSDAGAIVFDYEVPLPQDSQWCQFAFARVDLTRRILRELLDEFGNQISTQLQRPGS